MRTFWRGMEHAAANRLQAHGELTGPRGELNQLQLYGEAGGRFDLLEADMKDARRVIAFAEKRVKRHEKEFHHVG